jgi:tetratricopeptide (TPR) repeat protein/predicted Ser/Thr protein kinase
MVACLDDRAVRAWVRGEVPEADRDSVRAHLDTCDSCTELIASTLDTEWIGQTVGRYRIVERIGGGGMGEVFRAEDPELRRDVAIKLVRQGGSQQRLLHEAQAMARLAHPNVTRIYDVGAAGDGVFLAMELVEGRTLREWFGESARTWRDVVSVMRQAGQGLRAAHEAELVHGDFKPDNVLVARDGRVLVTDFGLARMAFARAHARASTATAGAALETTCGFAGTPAYMAPEQFADEPAATPASDQFSFCVTVFEGLYGRRPFAGTDLPSLRDAVVGGQVSMPPKAHRVPGKLVRAVRRGLATKASERFASMAELLAALDAAMSRRALVIAGGTAGLGAAVAATLLVTSAGSRDACSDGPSQLAGVWDASVRTKLSQAFAGSGLPYASTSLASVVGALDAYRDRWIGAYAETCKATHVRKEQSAALLDVRMHCLARRRGEAKALVDELSRGTADSVRDAVAGVNALRSIDDCADIATLEDLERLPADAAQRTKIAKVDAELARCRALLTTGQFKPGQACATAATATATELGYRPTIAESELIAGMVETRLRDWERADASITRALLTAEEARDARTRARALLWLVAIAGERAAFAQGHERAEHARAIIKGLGGARDLEADLAFHEGVMLFREGKLAPASDLLKKAVALREEVYGKQDARVAEPLAALASIEITRKNNDAAKALLDRALAIQEAALGASHPSVAKTLHTVAQLQLRMGKTDDALATQKRSYDLLVAAYGENHRDVALSVGVIAQAYMFAGKYTDAIEPAQRSADLMAKAVGDEHHDTAIALQTLAATQTRAGKTGEALANHQKALAIQMKVLGPEHHLTTQSQVNLAMALRTAKRCSEAFPLLDAALATRTKLFGTDSPDVMRVLHTLGDCRVDSGQPESAIEPLERVLASRDKTPPKTADDKVSLAMARYSLARALVDAKGDRKRATALAKAAHDELATLEDARATDIASWAKQQKLRL